jgi:hypothetical protein
MPYIGANVGYLHLFGVLLYVFIQLTFHVIITILNGPGGDPCRLVNGMTGKPK